MARTATDESLRQLYATNRWFELKDAIEGKDAAPLFRGAVASAFNRADEADDQLKRAMREAPNAVAANEARGLLALLYVRWTVPTMQGA